MSINNGWTGKFAQIKTLADSGSECLLVDFSEQSNVMLVAFGGFHGAMGMPVFEFLNITRNIKSKKIFIRDPNQGWYHSEFHGIGKGVDDLASCLKKIIRREDISKLVMVGNSMGGYGAILLGSLIQADEVHAFAPQTFINKDLRQKFKDNRWQSNMDNIYNFPFKKERYFDLKDVIRKADGKTIFNIYFSNLEYLDCEHALRLQRIPNVILHKYDYDEHNLVMKLRENGSLQNILSNALEQKPTAMLLSSTTYDYVIAGGGIVGLTVALECARRHPRMRIAVFEKENSLGLHASGRNSGVLHAGIYYGSDTLKAKVCSKGSKAMQEYALERGIRMEKTGKVIVAARSEDAGQIDVLEKRARENGIRVERLDSEGLKRIEPHARSFGDSIYSPDTAIIDAKAVVESLGRDLSSNGIDLYLGSGIVNISPREKTFEAGGKDYGFGHFINCAGAYADTIAHVFGVGLDYSIIPFRGSYYRLSKEKNSWVRGSIYPAPDLRYPFLGVHLTRGISGDVYLGPTATPALGRENYQGVSGIAPGELPFIFGRLARMYYRNEQNFRALVHSEIAKYSKKRLLSELSAMVPGLEEKDLEPCGKSGIRPQLVNTSTWRLEMDFIIESGPNSTHVLNAISPAFTGAFEFAKLVIDRIILT